MKKNEWLVDDKFKLVTWQFGDVHQMNILFINEDENEGRICIEAVSSHEEAVKTMLDWVDRYKKGGFVSAEEHVRRSYIQYPTLYSYRHQVLNHLFFVIGNGYDWADGCITDGTLALAPWDEEQALERAIKESVWIPRKEDFINQLLAHGGDVIPELRQLGDELRQKIEGQVAKLSRRRPFEDDGRPLRFYPVSQYSKIMNVPDNVSNDWLDVAIEAGELLLARQDPTDDQAEENRKNVASVMPRLYSLRDGRIKSV